MPDPTPALKPQAMIPPPQSNVYGGTIPGLPGENVPPMSRGTVYMSDLTRKSLEAAGWRDGDPLPGDLGTQLIAIRDSMEEEAAAASIQDSEMAIGWVPPKSNFVDIRELSKDKQAQVQRLLQDYKQQVEFEQRMATQRSTIEASIPPSVQGEQREQLIQQMTQAEQQRMQRLAATGTVIDDRNTPQPPVQPQAAAPPVAPPAVATPVPPPESPPAPPQPPTADAPATGAEIPHPTHCQRCSWPLNAPFEIAPTREDKEMFVAAVLGQRPFRKEYSCFNGKMTLTFRSLTVPDVRMIQLQLGSLVKAGDIVGDTEFIFAMHEFRLALSLERVRVSSNIIYEVNNVEEWERKVPAKPTDKMTATPIPRLVEYMYANGVTTEAVRRVVGNKCNDFQRLVEMLEVMADRPDFW